MERKKEKKKELHLQEISSWVQEEDKKDKIYQIIVWIYVYASYRDLVKL